jgi:hypothetical protein
MEQRQALVVQHPVDGTGRLPGEHYLLAYSTARVSRMTDNLDLARKGQRFSQSFWQYPG